MLFETLCCFSLIIASYRVFKYFRRSLSISLKNKWIVITGCDSGIGLATLAKLANHHRAKVIAVCLTKEGIEYAVKAGAECAIQCDISETESVKNACMRIEDICAGSLWAVVHNAGVGYAGYVEYTSLNTFQKTFAVNFFGPVNLNRQLLPMIKSSEGRIVFLSSVAGLVPNPGNVSYSSSKFALEAYADTLRYEMRWWNVKVSVVNPSGMKTPLFDKFSASHRLTWEDMMKEDPNGKWKLDYNETWINDVINLTKKQLEFYQHPDIVVHDICHALSSAHPKLRYISGTIANTIIYFLWALPEELSYLFKYLLFEGPKPVTLRP